MIEVEVKTTAPVNVNVGDVYTETFHGAPSENQAVLDKFNEDENGNLYYGQERIPCGVEIPSKTSQLENDSAYIKSSELDSVVEDALQKAKENGEFDGTNDYTQLKNKPKINGVELDGDKTLEELGIPTGGGDSNTEDYSKPNVRLIVDIKIDQEELPEYVEITEDIEGKPLALRKFIIQHDIASTVSYTTIKFNNMVEAQNGSIRSTHNNGSDTIYVESRDNFLIADSKNTAETSRYFVGVNVSRYPGIVTALPGEIFSIKISDLYPIKSGTFVKIWEIVE